jgi:hypothetical protein
MKRNKILACVASLVAVTLFWGGAQALAAAPGFTISATNITMPSSGNGSIPITLTSVNGFAGGGCGYGYTANSACRSQGAHS